MRFETVQKAVHGVPFIDEAAARFLYDLIVREKPTRILELGIAHGTATCYMAAALDEVGAGRIVSVDLLEAGELFSPSPEQQLFQLGLDQNVRIVRMQTGYTWFLHDEIRRLTEGDLCKPEYDLCIIDGPKNWTIDGCAFFLVDKLLKDTGWIIFDDYFWTYAEADTRRVATDGITHRRLSEEERHTPQVKEIFELLVRQHPHYSNLAVYSDWGWAVARKRPGIPKTYSVEYLKQPSPRTAVAGIPLASRQRRDTAIESRMTERPARQGPGQPARGSKTLCVFSPNHDAYSETFIRAHIERLPAQVETLSGGWLPLGPVNGKPLLRQGLFARAERWVERRVFKRPSGYFETRAVARFLTTRHAAAALCEYGPTGVACLAACRLANVPLIVHFHGFDAYDHATLDSFGRSYPELFRDAGAIVAVSRHMERTLLEIGAPREKLHYNPYGVDTTFFDGANPASAPPHFLAVGRFVDKKAPVLTILAFSRLASEVAGARLTMIGDGPLLEASRQLVQAMGIDDRVDFMGPRPPLDVAAAMRRSRAFVQHSVVASSGDSEGTPVAILEAGASGLPVVATRHRGIADVVVEGDTGFLVDEGDVEAMAGHMLRLAMDAELAAGLGRSAREHVAMHYSIEKSVADLWRIIAGTMGPGTEGLP